MDPRFHPAIAAIKAGDWARFRTLLREDPSLATARSSTSHPTLLQCVVLDGKDVPHSIETEARSSDCACMKQREAQ